MSSSEQSLKKSQGFWMRCPRLGGEVPFTYCLQEAGDLPCPRIIVCWQTFFPVEAYLRKTLSPQKWEEFADRKPKGKIASLLELIEEAKSKGVEE